MRAARRQREQLFREDLAPSLELFASLAQAGLAFDAALDRVLLGLDPERPLAREFRTFQIEVLAGTLRDDRGGGEETTLLRDGRGAVERLPDPPPRDLMEWFELPGDWRGAEVFGREL